jgi:hypothetical protein
MNAPHHRRLFPLFGFTFFTAILLLADVAQAALQQQWVAHYDGPAGLIDQSYDIATDAAGNTYVAGISETTGSIFQVFVAKYDSTGGQA